MGNEAFVREMKATRTRITFIGAPYYLIASGVALGMSVTALIFVLLLMETRNWLLLCSLIGLALSSISSICSSFQILKHHEANRG